MIYGEGGSKDEQPVDMNGSGNRIITTFYRDDSSYLRVMDWNGNSWQQLGSDIKTLIYYSS